MSKRAFSLLETLVTLALAGVILSVLGRILHDYIRLRQIAQARSNEVEVAEHGLRSLTRQLRQAADWSQPASGSGPRVTWLRFTQPQAAWLLAAAQPVPESAEVIGDELRQGPVVLCRGVKQLLVERPQASLLRLTLKTHSRTLHASVWRHW